MIKYLPLLLLIACGNGNDADLPPTYRCEFKEDFRAPLCTWLGCYNVIESKKFLCVSSAGAECEASYYNYNEELFNSSCPKGFENFMEGK